MIRLEPAGRTLEYRLLIQTAESLFHGRGEHRPLEAPVILGDRDPQLLQGGTGRHPDPGSEKAPFRSQVQVEPGTAMGFGADALSRVPVEKPARRVSLIRRLVLGKPDVALNPEHREPWITHKLRRKPGEPNVHLLDQCL